MKRGRDEEEIFSFKYFDFLFRVVVNPSNSIVYLRRSFSLYYEEEIDLSFLHLTFDAFMSCMLQLLSGHWQFDGI